MDAVFASQSNCEICVENDCYLKQGRRISTRGCTYSWPLTFEGLLNSPKTTPSLFCKTCSVPSSQPPPRVPSRNFCSVTGLPSMTSRMRMVSTTVVWWMWPWRNSRNQSKPSTLRISSQTLQDKRKETNQLEPYSHLFFTLSWQFLLTYLWLMPLFVGWVFNSFRISPKDMLRSLILYKQVEPLWSTRSDSGDCRLLASVLSSDRYFSPDEEFGIKDNTNWPNLKTGPENITACNNPTLWSHVEQTTHRTAIIQILGI